MRRRLLAIRALESAGACAAVAAGLAVLPVGTLLWQGRDAFPLAGGMLLIGALIGLIWGLASRPRLLDAALMADKQLNLADLLVSALTSSAADDPWSRAVLAMAEQRCRSLSADEILLRRFGARTWGGIGLATALVLTLGVISAVPNDSSARAHTPAALAIPPETAEQDGTQSAAASTATPSHSLPPDEPERASARAGDNSPGPALSESRVDRSSQTQLANSSPDVSGTATGTTQAPTIEFPRPTATRGDAKVGEAAGGTGGSSDTSTAAAGNAPGTQSAATPATHKPPEPSPWRAAAPNNSASMHAADGVGVPDRYRDVIQGYFSQSDPAR